MNIVLTILFWMSAPFILVVAGRVTWQLCKEIVAEEVADYRERRAIKDRPNNVVSIGSARAATTHHRQAS